MTQTQSVSTSSSRQAQAAAPETIGNFDPESIFKAQGQERSPQSVQPSDQNPAAADTQPESCKKPPKNFKDLFDVHVNFFYTGNTEDSNLFLRKGEAFNTLAFVPQSPPLYSGLAAEASIATKPIKIWGGEAVFVGGVDELHTNTAGLPKNLPNTLALAFYNNPDKGFEIAFKDLRYLYGLGNYLIQTAGKLDLSTFTPLPKGTKILLSARDSKFFPDELRAQLIKEGFLKSSVDVTGGVVFVGEDRHSTLVLGLSDKITADTAAKIEMLASSFYGCTVVVSADSKIGKLGLSGYMRYEQKGYDFPAKQPGVYGAVNAGIPINKSFTVDVSGGYERGFTNRGAFGQAGIKISF